MKKLSIFIILLIIFSGLAKAQEPEVTWEGLIKQKEKSDKEIQDPKKSIVSKTWMNRAQIFLNIYTFEISGLYKGMPAKGEGFQHAEFIIGKPEKITTEGNTEKWVYPRKILYFVDGALDKWEQTEFIDKDALNKSAEAFLKAIELDESGKLKDKVLTKDLLTMVKSNVINEAIEKYISKDYQNAYTLMTTGYELCKLPKNETDTIYKLEQIGYYQGIIALNAGNFNQSKEHFQICIDQNYQPGASYHYLAESYAGLGDTLSFLNKVKEGFEKHPEEEQLIIDLINYYMINKKSDEAVAYLDMAISKNPDNPSYYSAKATVFDNTTDNLITEYKKYMEMAYEFKKEAFRDRADVAKKQAADLKRDDAVSNALKLYNDYINNLIKAEELYNTSLEIDPKFFNAAYNLGRIDLKRNEINALHAEYMFKLFKETDPKKAEEFENLAKNNLNDAAIRFEASHKINPKDRDNLEILKRIYFRLRDKANEERINGLLDELGVENTEMN